MNNFIIKCFDTKSLSISVKNIELDWLKRFLSVAVGNGSKGDINDPG